MLRLRRCGLPPLRAPCLGKTAPCLGKTAPRVAQWLSARSAQQCTSGSCCTRSAASVSLCAGAPAAAAPSSPFAPQRPPQQLCDSLMALRWVPAAFGLRCRRPQMQQSPPHPGSGLRSHRQPLPQRVAVARQPAHRPRGLAASRARRQMAPLAKPAPALTQPAGGDAAGMMARRWRSHLQSRRRRRLPLQGRVCRR